MDESAERWHCREGIRDLCWQRYSSRVWLVSPALDSLGHWGFPDEFATWYKSPHKYVSELKKIAPELRVEGVEASFPPETTLVTLTYQNGNGK
jgi:hypothetical protein